MKVSQLAFKFVHSHLNGEPLDPFHADSYRSIRSLLLTSYDCSWSFVAKVADIKKDNGDEKANITFEIRFY